MPRAEASPGQMAAIAALPSVTITDLDGKRLSREGLAGRVVLVEMWATWCPPCRGTLGWLGQLKKRYGYRLAVVALAVQSEEAKTRKVAGELQLPLIWAMRTPELAGAFGDVSAVPTPSCSTPTASQSERSTARRPSFTQVEAKLASLLG